MNKQDKCKKMNERLRKLFRDKGVNEQDLVRFTGLSSKYCKSFLDGEHDLSESELYIISNIFHINLKYLEGESNDIFDSKEKNELYRKMVLDGRKK